MGQIEGLGEVREDWILAFTSSVTLNRLCKLSGSQFPQLLSGDNTSKYVWAFGLDLLDAENGNPLQYSCLENPMDTVHRVPKSQT